MSLQERLFADLKQAMRDQATDRRDAIRMVRAAIKNAEIDLHREATDEEALALIAQEVKRRQEALDLFRKAGRADLVAEEETQLVILEAYLPAQMPADEVERVVAQVVAELGATGPQQLGAVMRRAMAQLKGQADGRLVNEIARRLLG
jgi:hypothetical protein